MTAPDLVSAVVLEVGEVVAFWPMVSSDVDCAIIDVYEWAAYLYGLLAIESSYALWGDHGWSVDAAAHLWDVVEAKVSSERVAVLDVAAALPGGGMNTVCLS